MLKLVLIYITTFVLIVKSQKVSDNLELTDKNNKLALNLLSVLSKNENNFLSPLSITSTLLMLLNGANGITERELKNLLNIDESAKLESINSDMKNVLESIAGKNKTEVIVRLASRILTTNEYKLLESYEKNVRNSFNACIDAVDFKTNSLNITQEINEWTKEQTNGKISKLVDELNAETALVIANAIYFNGKWRYPFSPLATIEDSFFNNGNNEPSKVQMMRISRYFKYVSCPELNSLLVELPFSDNSNMSMIIILPDMRNGLSNMTEKLTVDILNKGLLQLNNNEEIQKKVFLSLPKFSLKTEYDLKNPLNKLGINTLFEGSADLSGINGQKNLKVSKAIHKAVLNVEEMGAEAAAVTGIIGEPVSWTPTINIKVDRPFVFFIIDNTTGLIIFLGQVQQLLSN